MQRAVSATVRAPIARLGSIAGFDGTGGPVQDRRMSSLRLVGLTTLASLLSISACGLRTDPDFQPVCKDETIAGDDETAGTDDATDDGSSEPRVGSCEDPIDLPIGQTVIVRGSLGGCSGTEGWCGGTGGEDVYRLPTDSQDVFVTFIPQETNFDPVLRVVRGDPCEEGTVELSEVCADIVNSVPGRGWFDQVQPGDEYFLIVDTELGNKGNYAFEVRFGEEAFGDDCLDALEEQPIELGVDGNFVWEAELEAKQGRLDSGCATPGDEDIFELILTGGGTLEATVEVLEGGEDFVPVVSIRSGCATTDEMSCGAQAVASFGGSTTAYLVVDQQGAGRGRYRLTVTY